MKKDEFCDYALSAFRPAESLLKMTPADKLDWSPGPNFMTMGQLICHLGDGIGTELRMLVNNSWPKPEEMSEAMKQGQMPTCTVPEALAKLKELGGEKLSAEQKSIADGLKAQIDKLLGTTSKTATDATKAAGNLIK